MRPADLNRIAEINREAFLNDDSYSDVEYLRECRYLEYVTVRQDGKIVGYIMFQELDGHIESLRRAISRTYRGKGLGTKLSKKLTRIADKREKDIYTYVSKSNLPSLNSNFKVGYRIYEISKDWVYIMYKARKRKNAKDSGTSGESAQSKGTQ